LANWIADCRLSIAIADWAPITKIDHPKIDNPKIANP